MQAVSEQTARYRPNLPIATLSVTVPCLLIGWSLPQEVPLVLCALSVVTVAMSAYWITGQGRRPTFRLHWLAPPVVALGAFLGVVGVSDYLATAGLARVASAILERERAAGAYPYALEELVGHELQSIPDAGLPGTLRTYRYHAFSDGSATIYFVYAAPFAIQERQFPPRAR